MDTPSTFDEMLSNAGGARQPYSTYASWFQNEDAAALRKKAREAEAIFRRTGITFNVYNDPAA
ncbi:MAG: circularly permuted type 2 ATP-grasp protein, partial [Pseudomonadota bacterium]